jgi:pyruvate/2-oxoglutarate dehydrogenase complex dihydrolipoamide acyltransferase (E2) component
MRTVRVKITALALVGALALTGCARNAEEAIRVGDVSIGTSQIEQAAAPLAEAAGATATGSAETAEIVAQVRQDVVRLTIFTEVARRYARERNVQPEEPDYRGVSASWQLDVSDPYVRLKAEADAYRRALLADATARTPTEDEINTVYDDYVAVVTSLGGTPATYEQIRDELLNNFPEYQQALGLRDALVEAAARYGVSVHPRFQPVMEYPLLQIGDQGQLTLVWLPLGPEGTGAVRSAE